MTCVMIRSGLTFVVSTVAVSTPSSSQAGWCRAVPQVHMKSMQSASKPRYEIERKFVLNSSSKSRLLAVARETAAKVCDETFTDAYYDDEDFSLTLSDRWLRLRNDVWQLKQPVSGREGEHGHCSPRALTTVYEEVTGISAVNKALGRKCSVENDKGLARFAWLKTQRTSFSIPWMDFDNVQVVLDRCESIGNNDSGHFEHTVGEIEICHYDTSSITNAEKAIDVFCKVHQLGCNTVSNDDGGGGKLVQYLRANSPRHYSLLLNAGFV